MAFKHITASGYLSGGAGTPVPVRIRSITVIPDTTSDGSWKIEEGDTGAGADLIPENNSVVQTIADTGAYQIVLQVPIHTTQQTYVTISNCELLIEHN
jgi:hypothetical protein